MAEILKTTGPICSYLEFKNWKLHQHGNFKDLQSQCVGDKWNFSIISVVGGRREIRRPHLTSFHGARGRTDYRV